MEGLEYILNLKWPALLLVVLCGIGYALKRSPVANWIIPWALMFCGGGFYFLLGDTGAEPETVRYPGVLMFLKGLGIGLIAPGLQSALKHFRERKNGGGETTFFQRKFAPDKKERHK